MPRVQLVVVDVDRVLDAIAIGGPLAERHRVGVADDGAVLLRHDMRHLARCHRLATALEVVGVRRFEFAIDAWIDPATDVVQIDRKHARHIPVTRVAHENPRKLDPFVCPRLWGGFVVSMGRPLREIPPARTPYRSASTDRRGSRVASPPELRCPRRKPRRCLDVAADIEAAEEQRNPDGKDVAYQAHAEEPDVAAHHAADNAVEGHPGGSAPNREQDDERRDPRLPQSWHVERLPDQCNARDGDPPDGNGERALVDRVGKTSGFAPTGAGRAAGASATCTIRTPTPTMISIER